LGWEHEHEHEHAFFDPLHESPAATHLPPRRTSTSDLLGDDYDGDALTVISLVLVVKQFESGGLR
jgi:hypothetical protein